MKKFNARRKLKVHVMCSSVIKSTRAWLEGLLGYFKQPSPQPLPPSPPLLLPPLWGKIGGGGTQKNRRHKRKGQKVGVLKGWEVGEIEGNGQYFAIKKGLK